MRQLLKPKRKFSMSFSVAFASVKSLVSMHPGDFVRNFVNRDLLYKPVVLGCGHISCFCCVFRAMDSCLVSHCPVCQHPYNHFPSICQLLHFLLLKLYPIAYKRREQQVTDEEKISDQFSPQLDNCLSASEPIQEPYIHSGVPPHSTSSSCNNYIVKLVSSVLTTRSLCVKTICIKKEAASKQSASQNGSPPACSTKAPKNAAWLSTLPTTDYLSMLSSGGPKVQAGVGCDYCGMCPIIAERYRCKDCKERMGFDLCED
ncbi:hypothetical protein ACSBR1_031224 [Camellia fascicularis]